MLENNPDEVKEALSILLSFGFEKIDIQVILDKWYQARSEEAIKQALNGEVSWERLEEWLNIMFKAKSEIWEKLFKRG